MVFVITKIFPLSTFVVAGPSVLLPDAGGKKALASCLSVALGAFTQRTQEAQRDRICSAVSSAEKDFRACTVLLGTRVQLPHQCDNEHRCLLRLP